jgi:hypothetical protein
MNELKIGLGGRFRLEAIQKDGSKRFLGEFNNMVLNSGLDQIGNEVNTISSNNHHLRAVYVGTGNSVPAPTQTKLDNPIARQAISNNFGTVTHSSEVPPYNEWSALYTFAFGAVVGNIAEIGVGPNNLTLTTAVLFSRALILDGGGLPTTITVTAAEALSVTFFHRIYPPTGTVTGTVTVGGINYDYQMRAAFISGSGGPQSQTWLSYADGSQGVIGPFVGSFYPTQTLGPITGGPTPPTGVDHVQTSGTLVTWENSVYNNGDFFRDGIGKIGLNFGNIAGGWGSCVFNHTIGCFQIAWTPTKIPKTALKQYTFTYRYTWGRYP